MDAKRMCTAADDYESKITTVFRSKFTVRPMAVRCPSLTYADDEHQMLQHLLYMCGVIHEKAATDPDKAMRWLCFIQGSLWSQGIETIDRFRADNKEIVKGR